MASKALGEWRTSAAAVLDEIEHAHTAVGGPKRGRRVVTRRLTHAYVLLLSAQFQRFCRELHTQAFARVLGAQALGGPARTVILGVLTTGRALDRGNPTPENILRDFRPICAEFWTEVCRRDPRNDARRRRLDLLMAWRNAIAHHDFTKSVVAREQLTLGSVRAWRRSCHGLATSFDAVVRGSVRRLVGRSPW